MDGWMDGAFVGAGSRNPASRSVAKVFDTNKVGRWILDTCGCLANS
jgi:hypothetical protein